MKKHFVKATIALAATTLSTLLLPSIAQALIRQVTPESARSGVRIALSAGHGLNLDFSQTGQLIQKVWLDDPSRIVLDFDSRLCEAPDEEGCGASIIHLRRINEIQFPNMPRTNTTLLTVVTADGPQRNTYLFTIDYTTGEPGYATVAIAPSAPPVLAPITPLSDPEVYESLQAVRRGLAERVREGIIPADSPAIDQIEQFIEIALRGTPLAAAAQEADVPMAVVFNLQELGTEPEPEETEPALNPALNIDLIEPVIEGASDPEEE